MVQVRPASIVAAACSLIIDILQANEPAPIPKPSPTHGSYHWTFERYGRSLMSLGASLTNDVD